LTAAVTQVVQLQISNRSSCWIGRYCDWLTF